MRERIRERLRELGAIEQARATEGAFISTIHGFCARLLRANALAAGIDPEFTVLDELEARRLADEAFDGALAALAEDVAGGVELIAAYGAEALRGAIHGTYAELRARADARARRCRAGAGAGPGDARACSWGRGGGRGRRARRDRGPGRQGACRRSNARALRRKAAAGEPWPGDARAARGFRPATAPRSRRRCASPTGRRWPRSADLRAAPGGGRATCSTRCCAGSARATPSSSAGARRLDFEDLELLSRELLREDTELRRPVPRAVRARDGRRAAGHQRVQLELIESSRAATCSCVGDAQQSIYGFRHADVELFERRGAAARGGRRAGDAADELPLAPGDPGGAQRAFGARAGGRCRPLLPGAGRAASSASRGSSC